MDIYKVCVALFEGEGSIIWKSVSACRPGLIGSENVGTVAHNYWTLLEAVEISVWCQEFRPDPWPLVVDS